MKNTRKLFLALLGALAIELLISCDSKRIAIEEETPYDYSFSTSELKALRIIRIEKYQKEARERIDYRSIEHLAVRRRYIENELGITSNLYADVIQSLGSPLKSYFKEINYGDRLNSGYFYVIQYSKAELSFYCKDKKPTILRRLIVKNKSAKPMTINIDDSKARVIDECGASYDYDNITTEVPSNDLVCTCTYPIEGGKLEGYDLVIFIRNDKVEYIYIQAIE